jgi:hypothetical protein
MTTCAKQWLACSSLLVLLVGCGQSGPKLVAVSGRVVIDEKPLTYGTVRFVSNAGPPAIAKLDHEGKFTLTTEEQPGCVPGDHAVEVFASESISEYENKQHAPPGYASAKTSGLAVTINSPTDEHGMKLTTQGPPMSPGMLTP